MTVISKHKLPCFLSPLKYKPPPFSVDVLHNGTSTAGCVIVEYDVMRA